MHDASAQTGTPESERPVDPVPRFNVAATSLTLPVIDPAIPGVVEIRNHDGSLTTFASMMVREGILRPEHFAINKDHSLIDACQRAFKELCDTARPSRDAAVLDLFFTDEATVQLNLALHAQRYAEDHRLKTEPERIGVLALHTESAEGPFHKVIGPELQRIEAAHPRLGQTVLAALDNGFDRSCRALTPRNGIHWASYLYWGSEEDETMRLEEMVADEEYTEKGQPKVKVDPESIQIFRKRDYVNALPGWAGIGKLQPLSLRSLRQLARRCPRRLRRYQPIIVAAIALQERLRATSRKSARPDTYQFDNVCWEICPYLVRWSRNDPLGQIWDDCMNNEMECGETMMDVNAVFTFHDQPTFSQAVRKLRNYLEMMHLTEQLLALLPDTKN